MNYDNHQMILKNAYDEVISNVESILTGTSVPEDIKNWIVTLTAKAEDNKGLLAVLVTLIAHKIYNPDQDIRRHQVQIEGGFSGRTIDTKYVTPFMKEMKFPAMAQSGWLTRSLEQPLPYTIDYPGKIKPEMTKNAFLRTINAIENGACPASDALRFIFAQLILLRDSKQIELAKPQHLSISSIIKLLERHFTYRYTCSGAARLPVLALFAAYQWLVQYAERFNGMSLCPLESHNSADRRSGRIGDIEIDRSDGSSFEGVEVKHGIIITPQLVNEAYEKFKGHRTDRYYLLTTANMDSSDIDGIDASIERIWRMHGCQVIVNGVYSTLRYYLRLFPDSSVFIDNYVELLKTDGAVKFQHKNAWNNIVIELCQ